MTLIQSLSSFWNKPLGNGGCRFREIICNDDIKIILNKAILSKKPAHILLVGKPGSAKTMFLTEIMSHIKESYFIVGSNTSKAGLVNQLFERRPKFLLIDELDKMGKYDQVSLLHLMETGIISETKIKKTRQTELTSWVFATSNDCQRIIEPLLSRFLILNIPEYTLGEFIHISVCRLEKEQVNTSLAIEIAKTVWKELGSRDVRDVIKVARLATNMEDISNIVRIMKHHPCRES